MDDFMEAEIGGSQVDTQLDRVFNSFESFIQKSVNQPSFQVDLIFVPMRHGQNHYFCICINFQRKKFVVLDTKYYKDGDWKNSIVFKMTKCLANNMSDYLEDKHENGSAVFGFEVEQESFKWQSPKINDEESGLFLLMNMLCYEGHTFELVGLMDKVSRRLIVVEISAVLALADINEERPKLLQNVRKFNNDKVIFWKNLEANRKINVIKEKKGIDVMLLSETELPVLRQPIGEPEGKGRGKAVGGRGKGHGRGL